jgi:lysophospholipase L1-like esterase
MRSARLAVVGLVLVFLPGLAGAAECKFSLKDGDRVVFYGDSITDQRLYTTFTETYAVTRFPKANITFVHSGWGGDRVTGGGGGPIDLRLDRDVIAYKPTVVTIMLGMNDASYQPFRDPVFNTYAQGYNHIVEKLKADLPGVRLTLIKPSPYDDVTRKPKFEDGYNAVLIRYGDFVRELAQKSGSEFADLNTLMTDATKKAFESDPALAEKINPDRVHPAPGGQLLMAYSLLKAWNAPAVVSYVAIDSRGGKEPANTTSTENAAVSELTSANNVLQWTQLDDALPFPIDLKDPVTELAVRSSDIISGLDRQIVKVVGLEGDGYTLSIDGKAVGNFTKAQLAEGVNLAMLATPMSEQAAAVHQLTLKRTKAHNQRWRDVQVPYASYLKTPGFAKALEGLDALEAEIQVEQRANAQPKPHKFELKPRS